MNNEQQTPEEWQYRLSHKLFKIVEPALIVTLKAATWVVNRLIDSLRWLQGDKNA